MVPKHQIRLLFRNSGLVLLIRNELILMLLSRDLIESLAVPKIEEGSIQNILA